MHRRLYGFTADEDPVQLVTFRVEATGVVNKAELKPHPIAGAEASGASMVVNVGRTWVVRKIPPSRCRWAVNMLGHSSASTCFKLR